MDSFIDALPDLDPALGLLGLIVRNPAADHPWFAHFGEHFVCRESPVSEHETLISCSRSRNLADISKCQVRNMSTNMAEQHKDLGTSTREADLAWIQLNYTFQLLADSRTVRTPQEAVIAHLRCWEKVISDTSDCRTSILKFNIEDVIAFRDTTLARITAEHYGFTYDELALHLRLAV